MSRDRLSVLGLVLLVFVVGALLASTLDAVGRRGPDESHYLTYVSLIHQQGLAAYGSFFQDYVGDESRWLFPNPLRLGYISVAALASAIGGASFETLSWISVVSHLLCVLAGFAFTRRVLGDPRALYVAVLLAFSPLWMALARRALVDSLATLAALVAIWAFWEALRAGGEGLREGGNRPPEDESVRSRYRWHAVFVAVFAFGMLVKETNVLLAIPFGAVLCFEGVVRGRREKLLPMSVALAAPLALCGVLWWVAAGSLGALVNLIGIILDSPSHNEYATRFGGGPWTRYVLDFLLLAPGTTLLAIAGLGVAAVRGRRAEPAILYLVAVSAIVLLTYEAFTKNVRYVAVLELPIRMLAVWGVWEVLHSRSARTAAIGCGVLVAALAVADTMSFLTIFVEGGLYDPVTAPLLGFRGLLPSQ